jgi:hypothetical protein
MPNTLIEETMRLFDEKFTLIGIRTGYSQQEKTLIHAIPVAPEYVEALKSFILSRLQAYAEEVKKEIDSHRYGSEYLSCPAALHGLSAKESFNSALDTIKNLPILNP